MHFLSKKQRKFFWANHPEVARRWAHGDAKEANARSTNPGSVSLRPMGLEDLKSPALAPSVQHRIDNKSFDTQDHNVLVAQDGSLVGLADFDPQTKTLHGLWVNPRFRGQGHGLRLLNSFSTPVERLHVLASNKRAQKFYRRQGLGLAGPVEIDQQGTKIRLMQKKAAESLQPGDIIIMSPRISAEDNALKRVLWQKSSPALQGSLTHSAIVGPDGQVIESRAGEGIVKKSFAKAVADKQYVVKRPPFAEATRRHAAEFAEKQLGKEYSWSDLLLQAVGGLLPRSTTVSISERLQLPREREGYTCSSLITAAYGRAHLADVPARATLPADLRFSDRLQEVVNKVKAESLPIIGRVSRMVAQDKTAGLPSFMKPDVALRPHQEEAVRKLVRQNGNLILSHPVGSGKTISVIAGVDRMRQLGTANRTLVVVPASLRGNFVAEVQKHTNAKAAIFGNSQEVAAGQGRHVDNPDPKADFHLVSYEMFRANPEAYIKASGADTVVYDECFVGSTVVETVDGPCPIRDVLPGQLVWAVDVRDGSLRLKRVLRRIEKTVDEVFLMRVHLHSTVLTCTGNHKFWTHEKGFVYAKDLGDHHLRTLRESGRERVDQQEEAPLLLDQMLGVLADEPAGGAGGVSESRAQLSSQDWRSSTAVETQGFQGHCGRADDERESDAPGRCPAARGCYEDWAALPCEEGREWAADPRTAEDLGRSNRLLSGALGGYSGMGTAAGGGRGQMLQDRSGGYGEDVGGGDRRAWAPCTTRQGEGCPEGGSTCLTRVDRVAFYESGSSTESWRDSAEDARVYDLEVEDFHTYFANGVLVSNCHKIKNVGVTGTALKEARKHHRNFIGLTGSIVSNTPADLVPLVDAMTEGKHHLGTKENFERRFMTEDGKMQNTPVMRMLLNAYIHHVDPQANEHTPRKVVEHVHVEMSPEQQELYQYVIGKMDPVTALKFRFGSSKLKSNDVNNIFNKMTQARQCANAIHTINKSVSLSESAQRTPKIKRVLDDVAQHLGETPDGQVIIYSNMIQGGVDVLSQGLKDRGIAHGVFMGKGQPGSTEASRQQAVRDYQEGKNRVILLSSAGGEGLNLGNTTLVANVDGHFNPEKIFQAEARGVRAGGQAHRPQEARKVIVRRYLTRVPISKTQAARDAMNLVSPNQAFNRLLDGQPLLYNPFRRERSPDEWAYEVAARKDTRNKDLRKNLDKSASWHPDDPGVPLTVEDMLDLIEIGLAERAEDTTKEAAAKAKENTRERRLSVQRLPMQPYRLVKSDTPVMNAYLKEFGKHLEEATDLTTALPQSELEREQQYIDALRAYYREAAKPHMAMPGKAKTDAERKKEVVKASLLAGLGLGGAMGVYYGVTTGAAGGLKASIPVGLIAGATAAIPTTGLMLWHGLNDPTFATAAARAKRMGKLSDEQMRMLLRGLEVQQKEEKLHRLAVGSKARAVTKQVQDG